MLHLPRFNERTKYRFLAASIGLIYFIFGLLKFFPNLSPAETIGTITVQKLSLGILSPDMALLSLATLEVAIGLCLLSKRFMKLAIAAAVFHMIMTFSPIFLFPEEAFRGSLLQPSLLTQYILKNIIIIFALLVIYPKDNLKLTGTSN